MCMKSDSADEYTPLTQLLEPDSFMPIDEALRWLIKICDCLKIYHANHGVHGELTAKNILVNKQLEIQLVIPAKIFDAQIGIIPYQAGDHSSPESLENKTKDFRSDIYGVGVVAYLLVTGQVPFLKEKLEDRLQARLHESPDSLLSLRPECSERFGAIIIKSLARFPEDRYQSVFELCVALKELERSGAV